ncbi:hypothetical protein DMUE_1832 [Dictyocoela muelleri]|nr:hypothetical protein DMUE_1832 [Dictyocoela muelleri]
MLQTAEIKSKKYRENSKSKNNLDESNHKQDNKQNNTIVRNFPKYLNNTPNLTEILTYKLQNNNIQTLYITDDPYNIPNNKNLEEIKDLSMLKIPTKIHFRV